MKINNGDMIFGKKDICISCLIKNRCIKLARLRSIANNDIIEWKICGDYKKDKKIIYRRTKNNDGNTFDILRRA